jgi:hypothetical protein
MSEDINGCGNDLHPTVYIGPWYGMVIIETINPQSFRMPWPAPKPKWLKRDEFEAMFERSLLRLTLPAIGVMQAPPWCCRSQLLEHLEKTWKGDPDGRREYDH